MSREEVRQSFLEKCGWADAAMQALPVDASARRYFRLEQEGETRILMDAPPGVAEDVELFARVARHLLAHDLSVPRILAEDEAAGFLLLEDFGSDTYTRLLQIGHNEDALYDLAVDTLVALQASPGIADLDVPPYDVPFLVREALLLADWHFVAKRGAILGDEARQAYVDAWREVLEGLPPLPETLVLRDFHVDNLMVLPFRRGVQACGLLDFQTAVIGSPAYDLVSLLEDARRDMAVDRRQRLLERYLTARPELDREAFLSWYAVLGAQRHAKVAGIFVRLYARDGKEGYLAHIPRVVGYLREALTHPALAPVKAWFETHYPGYQEALDDFDAQLVKSSALQSDARGAMMASGAAA